MNHLKNRILEISRKYELTHIGSCLSVLSILVDIYQKKKPGDLVILDGAHSHLAHLVVREKYEGLQSTEELLEKYGIHCDRAAGCDASGGSLGHGLGLAIGLSLANKDRQIYCIVTDGSLQEGSNWEAMRLKNELMLDNIKIIANLNGFTALAEIDRDELARRARAFCPDVDIRYTENGEGFEGVAGHYLNI